MSDVKQEVLEHNAYLKYKNLVELLQDLHHTTSGTTEDSFYPEEDRAENRIKHEFITDLLVFMGELK
jgi:hypothetical protein